MRIGELARRTGVNIQTIRFYERCRLLRKPPRTPAGYRIYGEHDLELVVFIRKASHFSFKLKEIRRLVQLYPATDECTGPPPLIHCSAECIAEIARMGQQKIAEYEQQMASLAALRQELIDTLRQLTTGAPTSREKPLMKNNPGKGKSGGPRPAADESQKPRSV
ncbi:MAG: MerR family transcriptional regulator [Acidobacteria bacterium]|nr:MerR family transcriptional regulator [Acidobacteriota bacterium]